jgi:AmiR/NasT family two-component response regulator
MSFVADIPMLDDPLPRPPAARIMICEDEGLTALRLRRALERLGYEVVGVSRDGHDCAACADRHRPDVILMDVQMPGCDGIEATRQIMARCPAAVIMLTAYSEPEVVQRALESGASGYLVKPVVDEQLRSGIAVARARFTELQQERGIATALAESFVGQPPSIPGFQLACRYQPASEAARIGGDYFDFIELDAHRTGIVIGDVCGSGLPTAVYTGMARHMLRAYCLEDPGPARVLDRLNRALFHQMSDECQFVTMVYGMLDHRIGLFTYCNAGHPPPILCDSRGVTRELMPTGGLVGVTPGMDYTERTVLLPPGAALALFTDGVTEARTRTEMFGSDGVLEVVRAHASKTAEAIAEAILTGAAEFSGGRLNDDAAILVLKHG